MQVRLGGPYTRYRLRGVRFGSVSYLNAPAKTLRVRLRRIFAGGLAPPSGGMRGRRRGGHRISDITGGPRNPALTRVITGPNGPPDIYMISQVAADLTIPADLGSFGHPAHLAHLHICRHWQPQAAIHGNQHTFTQAERGHRWVRHSHPITIQLPVNRPQL